MDACVGLFALAFGYWLLAMIANAVRSSQSSNSQGAPLLASDSAESFEARLRVVDDTLDDTTLRILHVEMKGPVVGPFADWPARISVRLSDATSVPTKPIRCFIPQLSDDATGNWRFLTPEFKVAFQYGGFRDWVTAVKVPVDALMFPGPGRRRLLVNVDVVNQFSPRASAEASIDLDTDGRGYEEQAINQRRVDVLTVELAVAVGMSDGGMDDREKEIIGRFMRKRMDAAPEPDRIKLKNDFNSAIGRAVDTGGAEPKYLELVCHMISELTEPGERYATLQLCIDIISADGRATKGELAVLDRITRGLEIDAARVQQMVDKQLPIQMHEEKNPETVLGVTSSMSQDQIRDKLNVEFRKWNSRATHKDPKVREQAEQMIALISTTREKHGL